jgi:hypothetical protein
MSNKSDADAGDEFLIPVAFDPTPEERSPPQGLSRDGVSSAPRDYFEHSRSIVSSERTETSRNATPHIAFQEKGRQPGNAEPGRWRQEPPFSTVSHGETDSKDEFKLQNAPKGRKQDSPQSSESDFLVGKEGASLSTTTSPNGSAAAKTDPKTSKATPSPRPSNELHKLHENGSTESARSLTATPNMQFPPKRGDSLEHYVSSQIQRKEVGSAAKPSSNHSDGSKDRALTTADSKGGDSKTAGDVTVSLNHAEDNQERLKGDVFIDPPRVSRTENRHARNGSLNTLQSEPPRPDAAVSPSLLRYSGGGDFSMDEDMARIWGNDGPREGSESFLKKVSNSVRHGRSFSDKGSRFSKDAKWPRSPANGGAFGQDISSPSTSSPEHREDISWLKSELRRERQRVIERDQKITELEAALNAQADVKQANSELKEKRSTMVVLDAKKEIVLQELAVLSEHLEAEKHGGAPMDLAKLTNDVVRGFAEKLQQLKASFAPQIEELVQKRAELVEELANLSRMKDKSFQEFEQLSSKNAQLAELNNQLVHQIQELYKAHSSETTRPSNGLGIYSHSKEKSTGSLEAIKAADLATSVSTMTIQGEAEPATILPGPQVVSIRKGQPRKFNWKRGGQNVAKGVTKGLKGAFSSEKENFPQGPNELSQEGASTIPRSQTQDPNRPAFGFFGNQKKQTGWKTQQNGSSPALANTSAAPADGMSCSNLINGWSFADLLPGRTLWR